MREIGGYFELEQIGVEGNDYHNTLALNSGRASLRYILIERSVTKVFLPFFCCNTLLEPIEKEGIAYEFLNINEQLEFVTLPNLRDSEVVLVINYFGLKNSYIQQLISKYGDKLIVDNTQNFFQKGYSECYSFNSVRKYFGVVDGSYLYFPSHLSPSKPALSNNFKYCVEHLYVRLSKGAEPGYSFYSYNESLIDSTPLLISEFSRYYLKRINYAEIERKRKLNFQVAHSVFSKYNELDVSSSDCGLFYPLVLNKSVHKTIFHKEKIFIPTIWPDVLERTGEEFKFEKSLVDRLIPIPIDHRYSETECTQYCERIFQLSNLNQ